MRFMPGKSRAEAISLD